ncbi:MAG: DEAD/DEAH box helicase [Salinirussus sp.]
MVHEWYDDTPGRPAVVASTNGSAAGIDRQFDLAIIDEATQATCATTAVPLASAETAVLAGDHQQLPPFSKTDTPPDSSLGLSLFEHLYANGGVFEDVGIQLRTQYRMHRDIAPADIGIITPYTAQADRIRTLLTGDDHGSAAPTVDTVDSFQGSERTVVLISFVRSNDEGRVGFLGRPGDVPRRLNVAMTRARRLCLLVGDWRTLARTAPPRDDHCTDLYDELYSYLADTGRVRGMDPDLIPM